MAYINVAEWTPDQVCDWLKGLDDCMKNYVHAFTRKGICGNDLLHIRPYLLEELGMKKVGHQEIVLEAVENLRNFHYNLKNENLQFMALIVATDASNLHREAARLPADETGWTTSLLTGVARTVMNVRMLITWLDRMPFRNQVQYREICQNMLRLAMGLATIGHRDSFVHKNHLQLITTADKLERLANYIIQDISDPMVLQPASLSVTQETVKMRESELGFNVESNYNGTHRITCIKYTSPSHNSGKIQDGDEIVQINYQTIVGWQHKFVLRQLREALPELLLTIKQRPKHTTMYGQNCAKPYRLPSKKRPPASRWGENLPSPRPDLKPLVRDEQDSMLACVPTNSSTKGTTKKDEAKSTLTGSNSSCSDILTPTNGAAKETRMYYPKPRAVLQRRNTICGDEHLSRKHSHLVVPSWHERKHNKEASTVEPSSPSLRDKSVSFGFGLEIASRPSTCIGLAAGSTNKALLSEMKKLKKLTEATRESQAQHSDTSDSETFKPGVSKVVRFDANTQVEHYATTKDLKYTCNVENTILETFEPIPFVDEGDEDALETPRLGKVAPFAEPKLDEVAAAEESVSTPVMQSRRVWLKKMHSTPTYDNTAAERSEVPPAIEPRKEFLHVTPPVPPPRPRKSKELTPVTGPPPPPKPAAMQAISQAAETESLFENELLGVQTSPAVKSHTLTLRKKHNLVAKRRNVNLNQLGTGDIQGFLFRRKKSRRGVTYWARVYFVMLDTILYGFRAKHAPNAGCVIFLPGFTVSLAKEVHSKPHAFKVYHTAKTFYFAAESGDALNQWLDFLRSASTQKTHGSASKVADVTNTKDLFSENEHESSGEEPDEAFISKNLGTPSPQSSITQKDLAFPPTSTTGTPTSTCQPAKSDRSYLNSLRKLTLNTFKGGASKPSSDIPVPTAQYRSYRKAPGGSFGIQIGTNTPGYHDPLPLPLPAPLMPQGDDSLCLQRKLSRSSSRTSMSSSLSNAESTTAPTPVPVPPPAIPTRKPPPPPPPQLVQPLPLPLPPPPPTPTPLVNPQAVLTTTSEPPPLFEEPLDAAEQLPERHKELTDLPLPKSPKYAPREPGAGPSLKKVSYNFLHASNPNLVEFDFHTSKTLDYSLPKLNDASALDSAHHHHLQQQQLNVQGFITLKDLMLRKQEEESKDMYNNRVLLGIEKRQQNDNAKAAKQEPQEARATGSEKIPRAQTRSLPKTPDYDISFKPNDETIKLTRTKEMLKLRDFGYETISGDEAANSSGGGSRSQHDVSRLQHQHTAAAHVLHTNARKGRQFANFLHKAARKSTASATTSQKNPPSSTPVAHFANITMTLPLKKKPKILQGSTEHVGANSANASSIKKSQTYNNDLKDKASTTVITLPVKYEAQRKNSAPMPIFSKFAISQQASASASPSKPTAISKKLLNSPLLHRTLFGHHQNQQQQQQQPITPSSTTTMPDYNSEIFAHVVFANNRSRGGTVAGTSTSTTEVFGPPLPPAPAPPTSVNASKYRVESTANEP